MSEAHTKIDAIDSPSIGLLRLRAGDVVTPASSEAAASSIVSSHLR